MSVGVVLVTHYGLGLEFLQALRLIVPRPPAFHAVSIDPNQSVDEMRGAISSALEEADEGQGVLVLTDMFGGTPTNISLSFLNEGKVEIITGVNLPMLLKMPFLKDKTVREAAEFLVGYGRRNLAQPAEMLRSIRRTEGKDKE